jgi:nitrous oxidase accessory protein
MAVPSAAGAQRTLRVGAGEAFATPAAALEVARAGDTIRVGAGVYLGSLSIDRRVALIGAPGAVLDGAGEGTIVTIAGDSVLLRGFVLRNGGHALEHDHAAVKVIRSRGSSIEWNRIERALHGIYLLEAQDTRLADNDILGDARAPEARRGNGVHLFHAAGSSIVRNRIRATRDGMYFSFSERNDVRDNVVSHVRYGLHYMYSNYNAFTANTFTRNAAGAALMFSHDITFRDNLFTDHVGYRAYGILLQTSNSIVAEGNLIAGNLIGVFLDMSTGNTFRGNTIAGNGIGVDLIPSAEGNVFVGNAITSNRTPVRRTNGGSANTWSVGGRGNYWGDAEVFDLDGDGVGDRPYRATDSFTSLAAVRPVLDVYTGTPAARALAWAETAFPLFDLPIVQDSAPLVTRPRDLPVWEASAPPKRERGRVAGMLLVLAPLGVFEIWRRTRHARGARKGMA